MTKETHVYKHYIAIYYVKTIPGIL